MDELGTLHDFWKQESPEGNFFVAVDINLRSATIHTALVGILTKDHSILEVGCNVGRNLNHLYKMGFRNIAGVEINEHAVQRLREEYPHLADVPVHVGTAEEVLPRIPDDSFDVVFTMAVLEHIHPDSADVFAQIARIAKGHVLAIEPKTGSGHDSHRQHPWDVPGEYAKHGLTQVRQILWSDLWALERTPRNFWQPAFDNYDATVFEVASPSPAPRGADEVRRGADELRRGVGALRRRAEGLARRVRARLKQR